MNQTTPQPSTRFKDAKGREWNLALNIDLCEEIRDTCDVNFAQLRDGQVFLDLGADPFKLGATLWLMCEKQAVARNIDPKDFKQGFEGRAIDAALEALAEAVILFTRAPVREPMRKVIEQQRRAQQASLTAVEKWAEANSDAIAAKAIAETEATLSTLSEQLLS